MQFSSCDPWRVFGYSNSPPQRALGRYRHASSFRQIFNIFSWLEPLNYYPDVGMGIFNVLTLKTIFSYNHFLFCDAQQSCSSHQKYIFCFFSLWWMIKGIWPLVPHIYNPVEQKVMAGQFHAPSHPGVLKKCKYEWEYTSEIFTHKNF